MDDDVANAAQERHNKAVLKEAQRMYDRMIRALATEFSLYEPDVSGMTLVELDVHRHLLKFIGIIKTQAETEQYYLEE